MKLTEIAIHPAAGRSVHLQRLSDGLNVVCSHSAHAGTAIARFMQYVLFGCDEFSAPASTCSSAAGYLQVTSGGHPYRLTRSGLHPEGQLAVSDIYGNGAGYRTPDWLNHLDRETWNQLFQVTLGSGASGSPSDLLKCLLRHFDLDLSSDVTPGSTMPFAADRASYQSWRTAADARVARLEKVVGELNAVGVQRQCLLDEAASFDRENRDQLVSIEHELAVLQSEWDAVQVRIQNERQRLAELDREIAELGGCIERDELQARQTPVSGPPSDLLLYYERLDEIDFQIRCWRSVQHEIQQQREKLRDAMTVTSELGIDSQDHPYHEARTILASLETRVRRTDELVRALDPAWTTPEHAREVKSMCHEMRDDLQALCNELGHQYTHVRHRAAVAELKQLRRCFRAMEENVQKLLARRDQLIAEIGKRDAAGATAIERADRQFMACAEQEGYLAARNRFLVEPLRPLPTAATPETLPPGETEVRRRLADLNARRPALTKEIHRLEQASSEVQPRRVLLINRRSEINQQGSASYRQRQAELDARHSRLMREMQTLERQVQSDRPWYQWKPNYFLTDAARYLARLTGGRWSQIAVDGQQRCWLGAPGRSRHELAMASAADQSLARLSLCLAAVAHLAMRGIRMPLVITEQLAESPDKSLVTTLESFCRNGHQVILVTASASLGHTARNEGLPVYELPDNDFIEPVWYPDPGISRPVYPSSSWPGSDHHTLVDASNSSPMANHYPVPSGRITAKPLARHEFPTAPIRAVREMANSPQPDATLDVPVADLTTSLTRIDLVESIYLPALESVNIGTIGELLDLDLDQEGPELLRRGFSREQLQRWQAQAWLLVSLPRIETGQARALVDAGITDPEMLIQSSPADVVERVERFRESSVRRRSHAAHTGLGIGQLHSWVDHLKNDPAWRTRRRPRRSWPAARQRPQELAAMTRAASYRSGRREIELTQSDDATRRQPHSPVPPHPGSTRPAVQYKFHLQLSDELETAPSIGPKTAERFKSIGVRTVDDFLNADAADMSARLENRRMSTRVIETWQRQIRLMCQVPNLRGHDVQLLVSCGINDPATLATMNADELLAKVAPFADSKEGARILRNSKKPDLAEVKQWIDAATHGCVLNAA